MRLLRTSVSSVIGLNLYHLSSQEDGPPTYFVATSSCHGIACWIAVSSSKRRRIMRSRFLKAPNDRGSRKTTRTRLSGRCGEGLAACSGMLWKLFTSAFVVAMGLVGCAGPQEEEADAAEGQLGGLPSA